MKYALKIFTLLIIIGCSNNSEDTIRHQTNILISNITPLKAKIGDTISISGSNLENLKYISFRHYDSEYSKYDVIIKSFKFISNNNEKITLKIPELVHENISIFISPDDSYELDLVGMIPIVNNFEHVRQIQVVDENTVFLRDNKRIYKSTDGFYKWEIVYESPNNYDITSFYYLNKNDCWIGLGGTNGVSIHYSENGGNDFTLFHQVHNSYGGRWIRNMKFFSSSKGFFVDSNQEMFVSDNNSFQNIYDYFPKLIDLPFGKIDIWDFSAIDEDLIFLSPSETASLIKIHNENITYSEFDISPSPPLLFDNIGYMQVNDYIYRTMDSGNSWEKFKTFDRDYSRVSFWNSNEGFAFAPSPPAKMYLTKDGGSTWEKYFTFPKYHRAHHKDFTEVNGLIGSANGRLWKYRKE